MKDSLPVTAVVAKDGFSFPVWFGFGDHNTSYGLWLYFTPPWLVPLLWLACAGP